MDADLQHPPAAHSATCSSGRRQASVDIVVASRYCGDGAHESFGAGRALLSRALDERRARSCSRAACAA